MTDLGSRQQLEMAIEAEAAALEAEGLDIEARSMRRQTWDRFRKHPVAVVSLFLLLALTTAFWVGPWLSPYTYDQVLAGLPNEGPSLSHPFGTDQIGRDLMVRVFTGGQISMTIAIVVALLTTFIGTVIGAVAGFFGGWVDNVLSALTNLFLIVPGLLVLLVVAIKWGGGVYSTAVILALLAWPVIARVVRGLFIQFKEQEFVQAAIAAGAKPGRIMFRHIIPNTFGPIIVNATLAVGAAIVIESTLSFLGLGVRPPTPSLGNIIQDYRGAIDSDPTKVLLPGLFVVLITLCANFLGDALRDALDPTSRRGH
ncbi:MAG: ABC transporter permease [Acidimicrobiia bacterium]|nr:ABC transporter permease [Acidimicrobiia bacterium]